MTEVITASVCTTLTLIGSLLCFGSGLLRRSDPKPSGFSLTSGVAVLMLAVIAARFLP